jgi:DNA repair protein RadD
MELRPYQVDCVEELRAGYRQGIRRQLLTSPTGSGKTVLFSFITKSSAAKGQRTVIMAHRAEILRQISETLTTFEVPHKVLRAGMATPKLAQTVVASVNTLGRRLDGFPPPDLCIVDEAHHSAAGTWARVFGSWPTTRFLGVTATPERLDGKGLGDYYDRMVRGPEVEWLIANGFLSPPKYFAPQRMVDASSIRRVAGEFAKDEAAKVFDKPTITGDAVAQYRKICPGKTAVVFAISIAHCIHVANQFRGSGIPAAVIDGSMTDEQRSQVIADLRARRTLVLVSCELISEGFDLPAVEAVILLRPTASLALHLQQIGRGLRPSPGKTCTYVLDHVGNCLRHGLAEEQRDWSLEGYAARKRKEQDALIKTRRCEKCFAIFNGPICPSCGAPYESKARDVEQVAGELTQISPEKMAAIRARKGEERVCQSLEDFQKLGAARGYKPGWARWRWQNSWRYKAAKPQTQNA